jgi:hypothetical protein
MYVPINATHDNGSSALPRSACLSSEDYSTGGSSLVGYHTARRGQQGAPEESQRFLGRMVAHALLALGYGKDTPDRGELAGGIRVVYEIVVEGVSGASTLARPEEGLVGMGEGCVQRVGDGVGLLPGDLVDNPEIQALQCKAEAKDDVVSSGDPERSVWLEDAPR